MHIAQIFQKSFCTHTCDRTLHTCVRARTFATHPLSFCILMLVLTLKDECNSEDRIHLYMKKDEKDDSAEIGCLMQGYIPLQT